MGSDTKMKIVKKEAEVSCWNCFTVEDEKRDMNPAPLSKIRKENREKFKLYSFLASEISKPKAVALKQKVSENYTVGKRLEEKLNQNSVSTYQPLPSEEKHESGGQENNRQSEVPVNPSLSDRAQESILVKEQRIKRSVSHYQPLPNDVSEGSNKLEEKVNKRPSSKYKLLISKEVQDDIGLKEKLEKRRTISDFNSLPHNEEQEDLKIIHKVQIETSTPILKRKIKPELSGRKSLDDEICEDTNNSNLTVAMKNIHDLAQQKETVTVDNSSSNGSESGYAGSSITVREFNENETNKSNPSTPPPRIDSLTKSSPDLDKTLMTNSFKSSLPALHLTKSNTLTTSTKSLHTDSGRKTLKSLRWNTICASQEELSHSDDEVYVTESISPGHATLPRRSNSPLPHERDMLDRDRFPINRSGLQARSESMASVYSGAGEGTRCNVTVRGEVQFSLLYNYRLGALEVGVKRCRDLAPVDTKRNRSDPYVKVYLLPDKSKAGKRKTKVKKNTLNPVFEETLSFVQPLASLSSRTLWLSVWHADMFGRNDFLGEVTLPLADVVFDDPAPTWHKLHERTEQFEEQQGTRGDLHVGLKFEVAEARGKGTLHVLVKEAKHLAATKPTGLADVFCKSYLLPERGRLAKQKTSVSRRTLNPRWEHTFTYRGLRLHELAERALELSLWDRDRLASNDFMGAVRLSRGTGTYMGANVNWMDSVGKEVSLWQTMMDRPNFWVEGSIPLRPQLNN